MFLDLHVHQYVYDLVYCDDALVASFLANVCIIIIYY
jgi:hypothetical protein